MWMGRRSVPKGIAAAWPEGGREAGGLLPESKSRTHAALLVLRHCSNRGRGTEEGDRSARRSQPREPSRDSIGGGGRQPSLRGVQTTVLIGGAACRQALNRGVGVQTSVLIGGPACRQASFPLAAFFPFPSCSFDRPLTEDQAQSESLARRERDTWRHGGKRQVMDARRGGRGDVVDGCWSREGDSFSDGTSFSSRNRRYGVEVGNEERKACVPDGDGERVAAGGSSCSVECV